MSFHPDPSKQAKVLTLSCKSRRPTHSALFFTNNNVSQNLSQKHLGVIFDFKLTSEDHLNSVLVKVVCILRKLRNVLPKTTLITIYKAFMKPHLEYGDVLYN